MLPALIELQRLKRLERTGWALRGLPGGTESVAAHSFGVGVVAMMLADKIKKRGLDVDVERILKMALLHDWAETRVGDLPRTAANYFADDIRKIAETAAFADVVATLDVAGTEYKNLYQDYEHRKSLEARLVKAADVIDLLIQAYALEQAGAKGLDEFWEGALAADFQLPTIAQEVVGELMESLLDARDSIN